MTPRRARLFVVVALATLAPLAIAAVVPAVFEAFVPPAFADATDRKSPLPPGESAPDIRLEDQHGRSFALGDVLKQRDFVVLAFYPKAFTSG